MEESEVKFSVASSAGQDLRAPTPYLKKKKYDTSFPVSLEKSNVWSIAVQNAYLEWWICLKNPTNWHTLKLEDVENLYVSFSWSLGWNLRITKSIFMRNGLRSKQVSTWVGCWWPVPWGFRRHVFLNFEVLICREAVRQKSFHLPYMRAVPIDNFVHVDAVGGSWVGIDGRRVTRQQRTARVGDRMVIKITKNERNDKTTCERDKGNF